MILELTFNFVTALLHKEGNMIKVHINCKAGSKCRSTEMGCRDTDHSMGLVWGQSPQLEATRWITHGALG